LINSGVDIVKEANNSSAENSSKNSAFRIDDISSNVDMNDPKKKAFRIKK